jgi:hypothetical protein
LLKTVNIALENEDILNKVNVQTIVSHLVKKPTFSNIQVRKLTMQAFVFIMNKQKQEVFLNMLLPYLGSTSDHIREEVLHLIIASFIKGDNKFDYIPIVNAVGKLLDDPKANVRFASTEALSALVFKGDKEKVYEILYEIIERKEYNRL